MALGVQALGPITLEKAGTHAVKGMTAQLLAVPIPRI